LEITDMIHNRTLEDARNGPLDRMEVLHTGDIAMAFSVS
jgi:hypothetical protein